MYVCLKANKHSIYLSIYDKWKRRRPHAPVQNPICIDMGRDGRETEEGDGPLDPEAGS